MNLVDIKEIGCGQSGRVVKCLDLESGRIYAKKVIKIKLQKDQIKSLYAEAAMRQVQDERIVRIYGIESRDLEMTIVMEWMDIGSLGAIVKSQMAKLHQARPVGTLNEEVIPEDIIGYLLREVLNGLVALKKKDIMHRDVKPGNVLINSKGKVKLCDFGESTPYYGPKETECANSDTAIGHKRVDSQVGTIAYMSPERILGKEYDERAEVWSIGIMALELYTGKHPLLEKGALLENSLLIHRNPNSISNHDSNVLDGLKFNSSEDESNLAIIELVQSITRQPIHLHHYCNMSNLFKKFLRLCLSLNLEERPLLEELLLHPFIQKHSSIDSEDLIIWIINN